MVVRFDTDQPVREQREGVHGVPRSAANAPRTGRTREPLLRPSKATCPIAARERQHPLNHRGQAVLVHARGPRAF